MNEEKQIEEMVKDLIQSFCINFDKEAKRHEINFTAQAEALYNAGYRKQEWISVDERLPKTFDTVLIYDSDTQSVRWATYWGKTNMWCGGRITHWMPLPEAPKMKGGAE